MAGRAGEPKGSPVPFARSSNPVSVRHPVWKRGAGSNRSKRSKTMQATSATGTPALAHVPGNVIAGYPLSTEEFAARNLVDANSIRARLSRTGTITESGR